MHALITGGAGFIGSHLAESLLADGGAVTVIDDLSTGRLTNLADAQKHSSFQFVRGTVRDESAVRPLVERADVVYHLAAAVGVRRIVEAPVETMETNIQGTGVILAAANRFRRPVFLASTSEVYGRNTAVPFREDADMIFGSVGYNRWSYACSKVIDEFLGLAYHQETQLPVVVGRLFNVIGPRQTGAYGMVVPNFVRSALRNEPLRIHGDGRQTRCFCHVRDIIQAIQPLPLNPRAAGEVFNIGATEEISINALADAILELTDSRSAKEYVSYEEAFGRPLEDMMRRRPDTAKLHALTGWSPQIPLRDALRDVVEFMRAEMNESE
ncbi:MAG: GDP-mannose 4,6-dehydratase [Phycisphaerae bacterium]|nr:GDP-mannose 4,6-dehydratase [Phycisphaerae bacterium]